MEHTGASIDNLQEKIILSLKTMSFLHIHSDHIMESSPILISILNLRSIPCSQFPKTLATLVGGYILEATWMMDHIDLAKRH
jgi:hypothetical protein